MPITVADLARRWFKRNPDNLTEAEARVLQSAVERRPLSKDLNVVQQTDQSTGERIADRIAQIGGSWSFILGSLAFLAVWVLMNVWLLGREAFDPYPFIFLNLVLSMIAAIQAPVIMMSQNRQSQRDRLDAAHDYEVNLKAEIEIMALHEKLDEMRHSQIIGMRDELARIAEQLAHLDRHVRGEKPAE